MKAANLFILSICVVFGGFESQAFYNPQSGRWLSRDPIEEDGGLNLFSLGRGDSVNQMDKLGLQAFSFSGKACSGTINVNTYSLISDSEFASTEIVINFARTEGKCTCCPKVNWIQVADIDPGEWNGRPDPYVDPNPHPSKTLPYHYFAVSGDQTEFWDTPKLSRSRASGGKTIANLFEICLVCVRQPDKEDVILGCVSWGFNFTENIASDSLRSLSFRRYPSSWFTTALRKDFPSYKFMTN